MSMPEDYMDDLKWLKDVTRSILDLKMAPIRAEPVRLPPESYRRLPSFFWEK